MIVLNAVQVGNQFVHMLWPNIGDHTLKGGRHECFNIIAFLLSMFSSGDAETQNTIFKFCTEVVKYAVTK